MTQYEPSYEREFRHSLTRMAVLTVVGCIALCLGVATCSDVSERRAMARCTQSCGAAGVRAFDHCECEHGQTQTIHVRGGQ